LPTRTGHARKDGFRLKLQTSGLERAHRGLRQLRPNPLLWNILRARGFQSVPKASGERSRLGDANHLAVSHLYYRLWWDLGEMQPQREP
jgi:hypothetical protein